MSIFDVPRCEDCGIPLDRHGEECGYYADEEYGNPEYGRPAGWLNVGTGEFAPIEQRGERITWYGAPAEPED